jgi:hypothetical protein
MSNFSDPGEFASRAHCEKEIAAQGIPILADDCTVSSTGMWFL